ncbi:CDP-glycerol glycerophosphotransferase family protein [Shouchella lehensis]|uniref:Teichoic acid biosynthesis protein F n=1 Tax=Shouchella lehensis G1 TaxID=1246626 RepID=A0A060M170_9BACI|nr:CDP-glycerol glycerophosphotransferase family protein [Shouchella lehensis]AIC96162.1 teichoic acid biosynthesis protein F [Shouchella lehensis G1]
MSFLIGQQGRFLTVSYTAEAHSFNQLVVRTNGLSYTVANTARRKEDRFFKVDLDKIAEKFDLHSDEESKLDFYTRQKGKKTTRKRLKIDASKDVVKGLSMFETEAGAILYPYITVRGNVAVRVNKRAPVSNYIIDRKLKKLAIDNQMIQLKGEMHLHLINVKQLSFLFLPRTNSEPIRVESKAWKSKKGMVSFNERIDLSSIKDGLAQIEATEDMIDTFVEVISDEVVDPLVFRLGGNRLNLQRFTKGEMWLKKDDNERLSLVPYLTTKSTNLSFIFNQYDEQAYQAYIDLYKKQWISRNKSEKKVWIIGEYPYKAQDNGFYFFKYLREHMPEIPAYYVINHDSPELRNVEPYGNILIYKSKEHFEKMLDAKYICGTHHPQGLFPIRSHAFMKKEKTKKVFLQHGILGTKNIKHMYEKNVGDFITDLFVTSSKKEAQIVIEDLKYKASDVVVTGIPRFEGLFKQDLVKKKQILIIPTWREWLVNDLRFQESEYLKRYQDLLHDERLKQMKDKHGVEIVFCLHPNMKNFISYFEHAPVTVIKQGERDVQDLIKESAVMITDYSSVAFDFAILHKPVIYYQFDQNAFLGDFPSHLDLQNDLPGEIVYDHEALIAEVETTLQNNMKMSEVYRQRADTFIDQRDGQASARIVKAILAHKKRTDLSYRISESRQLTDIYRNFKASTIYLPAMKTMFTLLKMITPIKKNVILFESGVGKRYEDSPKAIYEELLQRNKPFQYIWVQQDKLPIKNEQTKVIQRLSPQYFYYLARSHYWVNNQNFPTYLKKRKETTYVQTWHGTPLKKMANDIEQVHGRDDSYVERVTAAAKNWSVLLSPSPYATKSFISAFQFQNKILETGYPRNDLFFRLDSEGRKEAIRKKLNLDPSKKVILYAPTFRDNEKVRNKFAFNLRLDLDAFAQELGEEYVLLLRMHVVIAGRLTIPTELKKTIVDVSNYPDIQDLMLLSDGLVTDYSSVMFDYVNTGKPMVFFAYDLDEYKNDLRGFYMDFEKEAPGPIVKTSPELMEAINQLPNVSSRYKHLYDQFKTTYAPYEDGEATKRVVDKLFP